MNIACPFLIQEKSGVNKCEQPYPPKEDDYIRPLNPWKINEEVFKEFCLNSEKFPNCPRYKYAVLEKPSS